MVAPFVAAVVPSLVQSLGSILDRVLPDPEARDRAKLELLRLEQSGSLEEAKATLQAILAEASSPDPWTSRARPAFLYVMYAVILSCLVGSIIGIWFPAEVSQAAANVGALLSAIPESLWWLFGAGYLGYTGARSFDKLSGKRAA